MSLLGHTALDMHEFAHHLLFPIHSSSGVSWAAGDLLWGGESWDLEQNVSLKRTVWAAWFGCSKAPPWPYASIRLLRGVFLSYRQRLWLPPSITPCAAHLQTWHFAHL